MNTASVPAALVVPVTAVRYQSGVRIEITMAWIVKIGLSHVQFQLISIRKAPSGGGAIQINTQLA